MPAETSTGERDVIDEAPCDNPSVRVFLGVTDGEWYRFLAQRPYFNEVNYWLPSGQTGFAALSIGEPFLFKSHYPENRIVGGGFFSGFVRLRTSEAWDLFGPANGAATLKDLRRLIARHRRETPDPGQDPEVGCVLVRDTQFFGPEASEPAPVDFAKNIVRGKTYDLSSLDDSSSPYRAAYRLVAPGVYSAEGALETRAVPGPVFGSPHLVAQRLGQQSFQALVLAAYGRHCAITGAKIRPVLQAAHIRPVSAGGEHRLDNGLLLRSDVHTMFDRGYLAVDTKYRLRVSSRIREEFDNGEEFYARQGLALSVPERRVDRPNREFLEWHNDEIFLAS